MDKNRHSKNHDGVPRKKEKRKRENFYATARTANYFTFTLVPNPMECSRKRVRQSTLLLRCPSSGVSGEACELLLIFPWVRTLHVTVKQACACGLRANGTENLASPWKWLECLGTHLPVGQRLRAIGAFERIPGEIMKDRGGLGWSERLSLHRNELSQSAAGSRRCRNEHVNHRIHGSPNSSRLHPRN